MEKRGQITLFLIIGALLVLGVGVLIYTQRVKVLQPIEEQRPVVAEVPSEVQPIRDYITNCVYETAKDGLLKLGAHGGYIEQSQLVFNPVEPTAEEAVQFSRDSDLIIPYWWHMSDKNGCQGTCAFSTKRPPLYREAGEDSIESQLDEHINKNLKKCINNFKLFVEQGFSFSDGNVQAQSSVAKDDVFFLVDYPVTIRKFDKTFELREYAVEIPLNLREIYLLATNITNLQAQYSFIEQNIRQMIDTFSRVDSDALPPPSDLIINFGYGTVWLKSSVAEKLKNILSSYIQLMQVSGAGNYRFIESPANVRDPELYETVYNRGMIIPLNEDHRSLDVRFSYLDSWQPYFDLNCRGEFCQPESVGSTFGFIFGFQRYSFAYDVSIPVLVDIANPSAFGGEGYSFKFFLEANMRNNEPMLADFAPLTAVGVPTTSLLCDIDKRNPNNVTVRVIDGRTRQALDDAEIAFSCGKESCSMGKTINGSLTAQFPRCIGGIVGVEKSGYQPAFSPFDTDLEEDGQLSLILEPYRLVDFKIKKYLLKKNPIVIPGGTTVWRWQVETNTAFDQEADEETLVMMQRIGMDYEKEFNAMANICGAPGAKAVVPCGQPPEDLSKDIRIIPGRYKVSIYTFKYPDQPVIIPKHRHCERVGIGKTKKECYYIPEKPVEFNATNPLISGMSSELEVEITPDELANADAIEFYYLNFALEEVPEANRRIKDLSQLEKLDAYSKELGELLKPKMVKE